VEERRTKTTTGVEKMEDSKLELITEPLRTSFRQLISRCEKAAIEYELKELPLQKEVRYYLRIYLPIGRDRRTLILVDSEDAEKLTQIEFEKYVFIQGYESTCSYEYQSIEAYIRLFGPPRAELVFSRLLNIPYREIRKTPKEDLVFEVKQRVANGNPITITISQPTKTMLALADRELDDGSGLTIKIRGSKISNNNEATAILEKLANSLFFEIRSSRGIPLMLETHREPWSSPRLPLILAKAPKSPITFPKYQYDIEPLNLYWYATSAYEMPILQFLVYYQVLEFYFPIYSRREVQAEVANIVKDPQFNPDHHLDIGKVISTVQTKLGRGYGDERAQMRATIKGCVQDKEVRELLERDDIKEHFKADYKKLSPVKVSVENKGLDLREQLAERLYDIRCKIVHTKSDETEIERIRPFTKEEDLLAVEVEIVEFIARKAIIAGSKKLAM